MNKKTMLATAAGLTFGGAAFSANAALTSSATLSFTLGTSQVVACTYGTTPPCNENMHGPYNITDIVGSYFGLDGGDGNGLGANEKIPMGSLNGIHIGTTQLAGGSHTGIVNGTESPNIDNPWNFFGNTGMHQTTSAITATVAVGAVGGTLDMSGWNVTWNGITSIPLVQQGAANIECNQVSCSDSSNYTLDATFHVAGAGFTTVDYALHLEGTVSSSAVPIPAALWLFGSGLLGLIGAARRKCRNANT